MFTSRPVRELHEIYPEELDNLLLTLLAPLNCLKVLTWK